MIQGASELAAICVGLVGLIGASAATGLPMWKVTAFIGENIIVMETRWEGLWMNCYRQANIRMQCKVYDSLLYLPPELQAARGLMCTATAFSALGLLVALAGMRCVSCIQGNDRAKTIILMVAGVMQFMACICVFIPVSWTGHAIISDFYNPLLINAQRRELGEALYIGWVTGAVLFASSMLFVCRRIPKEKSSFNVHQPPNFQNYKPTPNNPAPVDYHPLSTLSSFQSISSVGQNAAVPLQNVTPMKANNGVVVNPVVYNLAPQENAALLYQGSMAHSSSVRSSNHGGSLYTLGNSLYISQNATPCSLIPAPTASYQSSFHPVRQNPFLIAYEEPRVQPLPHCGTRGSVYI